MENEELKPASKAKGTKQNPDQSMSRPQLLLKLFVIMFYTSACTFGGGFVIITLFKKKFVDELHWIEEDEMLDLTALSQSSPGAIAVNAAMLVGWRMAGAVGMVVCAVGTILPPMIILSIIFFFYRIFITNYYVSLVLKGMQAGVAAVIADVVLSMGGDVIKSKSKLHIAIMVLAFVLTWFLSVNVIFLILGAAVLGVILALHRKKEGL